MDTIGGETMTDKQIIYDCPHVSFTDWGTYACRLYDPRDKNCLVKGGNCISNTNCPYKQSRTKEQECEEWKENCDNLIKVQYGLADNNKRLRQAIEKVREYSKCGWDMFMERNSYEDYEAMAEWMKNQFYFILQICNEVTSE
jgi:hypothetical protein